MKKESLFGFILSILGLGFGLYVWLKDSKEKEPTFIVNPIRTKIIDSDVLKNRALNITDSTGKPISENVYVITFYFFNQGKQYIENSDILDSIRVGLKGGKILDKKMISSPRRVTKLMISASKANTQGVFISFKILEEGDGFVGQIIYSGNEKADLFIEGAIKDVRSFRRSYKILKPEDYVLIIVGTLIIALIVFNYLIRNLKQKEVPDENLPPKQLGIRRRRTLSERLTAPYQLIVRSEQNLAERRTLSFTYARLVVILSTMFFVIFITSLFLSKTLLSKYFDRDNSNKLEIPVQFRQ